MSWEASAENELEPTEERPQQFGLADVFLVLTGVAMVCAILAPLARTVPKESYLSVGAIVVAQVGAITVSIGWAIRRRKKLLDQTGRRLGVGYKHGLFGPAWVRAFAVLGVVSFIAIQLTYAGFILFMASPRFDWLMIGNVAMLGAMGGGTLLKLRQGREIGASEIFANGFVIYEIHFIPWERFRVRKSKTREGAIDITVHPRPRYSSDTISTLYVSDELRDYLLKHHGEQEATDS